MVTVEGGEHVTLLDERLRLRREIAIPTPVVGYVHPHVGVDATCSVFAVSHRTGLRVFSAPEGDQLRLLWETRHQEQPWYAFNGSRCVIDRQSRVWWVQPDTGRTDRIVVSDVRTGEAIADALIEQFNCHYYFSPHPDGDAAVLDGAAGQDGSFVWQVLLDASDLSVCRLGGDDRIRAASARMVGAS